MELHTAKQHHCWITFSCISQGVHSLWCADVVALSAIHEMGHELSAFDVIPKLFYPGLLLVSFADIYFYNSSEERFISG